MRVIVSGGTGFIGKRLVPALQRDQHEVAVWTRNPEKETRPDLLAFGWDPLAGPPSADSLAGVDGIIHLAGAPVGRRWSDEVKMEILESRVLGTRNLVTAVARIPEKLRPKVLICASGVGYYGFRGDEILTEQASAGSGFLAEVCTAWEREADRAAELELRVMKLRISVVLGADGGALAKMLPAFHAKAGGKLGSGKQWMSWIHVDDMVAMLIYALGQPVRGVWNAASPHPVRNAEFTDALGEALGQPAFLQVPEFALKLMFGEMSEMMLGSQRVLPEASMREGFNFQHPEIRESLKDLLHAERA